MSCFDLPFNGKPTSGLCNMIIQIPPWIIISWERIFEKLVFPREELVFKLLEAPTDLTRGSLESPWDSQA